MPLCCLVRADLGPGDSERKGSQLTVSHVLTAADMGVGC